MTKYCLGFSQKEEKTMRIDLSQYLRNSLVVLLVAVFVGAGFAYLFAVNTIASKGFQIKELEKKINLAKTENEKLQLRMVELRSMTDLQEKIEELDMVPVDQITYYDTTGPVMVRR